MTSASRTVLCAKSMRLLQMNKRRRSRLLADYYHGNQNFVWFTGKKKTILKKSDTSEYEIVAESEQP